MTSEVTPDHATFTLPTGFVKLGVIENKNGPECWVYEIESTGGREVAEQLADRALQQAKEWGFGEVWANVANPKLAVFLRGQGWTPEQVILKGKTYGN